MNSLRALLYLVGANLVIADKFTGSLSTDALHRHACLRTKSGYAIPDPAQCDRYAHCLPNGAKVIKLCLDGYALDLVKGACDLLAKVDCGSRPSLQPPTVPAGSECPRAWGFYRVAGDASCSRFLDCRQGVAHPHSCPEGSVFDPALATCVHPDQSTRAECSPAVVHNFRCPDYKLKTVEGVVVRPSLKFGDHDRFAHPSDCSKFFTCLLTGTPRLSSCTRPKVFNPATGYCQDYRGVPGCEEFYSEGGPNRIVLLQKEN